MRTESGVRYAHCAHCCWGSTHHPDDAPDHATPCVVGCASHDPIQGSEQGSLFGVRDYNLMREHN